MFGRLGWYGVLELKFGYGLVVRMECFMGWKVLFGCENEKCYLVIEKCGWLLKMNENGWKFM